MGEERERIRCQNCELVQWSEQAKCRRCGVTLPLPVVKIVERVVERVVTRQDTECIATLDQAQKLIARASERLTQQPIEPESILPTTATFPTMAEVERAMIVAAYQRSSRKPLEAARLLGIGKTTFYRKLRQIMQIAA